MQEPSPELELSANSPISMLLTTTLHAHLIYFHFNIDNKIVKVNNNNNKGHIHVVYNSVLLKILSDEFFINDKGKSYLDCC